MREDIVVRNLRQMAWERAKGELKAMLQTYWDEDGTYEEISALINGFVDEVEGQGLQE